MVVQNEVGVQIFGVNAFYYCYILNPDTTQPYNSIVLTICCNRSNCHCIDKLWNATF